jgi:hypothetical protein
MKRFALVFALVMVPGLFAQEFDHVQAGGYADYFR